MPPTTNSGRLYSPPAQNRTGSDVAGSVELESWWPELLKRRVVGTHVTLRCTQAPPAYFVVEETTAGLISGIGDWTDLARRRERSVFDDVEIDVDLSPDLGVIRYTVRVMVDSRRAASRDSSLSPDEFASIDDGSE